MAIKSGIITLEEIEETKNLFDLEEFEKKAGFHRYWITVTYNPQHHNASFGNWHVRAKTLEEAKKIAFKAAIKADKKYFQIEEMTFGDKT